MGKNGEDSRGVDGNDWRKGWNSKKAELMELQIYQIETVKMNFFWVWDPMQNKASKEEISQEGWDISFVAIR